MGVGLGQGQTHSRPLTAGNVGRPEAVSGVPRGPERADSLRYHPLRPPTPPPLPFSPNLPHIGRFKAAPRERGMVVGGLRMGRGVALSAGPCCIAARTEEQLFQYLIEIETIFSIDAHMLLRGEGGCTRRNQAYAFPNKVTILEYALP